MGWVPLINWANYHMAYYSPQGDLIASSLSSDAMLVWDVETGALRHRLHGGNDRVAYSPQGDLIAYGSQDQTVRLWDLETDQYQEVIQGSGSESSYSMAWKVTPNGKYLVVGSADRSVRRWQVIKEGEKYKVVLCWSSTHSALVVTGISIEGVQGLSHINKQLLQQRGSVGEPLSLREPSKKAS